jgi:rhamnulokinase
MTALAAVDLGAQSGRVAVGRFDGERLSTTDVHRFANVPVQAGGTLYWDILRLYRDVLDGLRAAATEAGRVDSVAVDSWAVDFGLLDKSGRLLGNPVHYRDTRRAHAMPGVLEQIPPRRLYERTGIQLLPINTLFELAAMASEPDRPLDAAASFLLIPDLIHYWLCGSRMSEFTNATTTQCFDPVTGGWANDLLDRLGVPTALMPEVVGPGTKLGSLAPAIAEETRLDADVIAVATHDTGSAVAAISFSDPHSVFISAGTWSLVGLEIGAPIITDASFAANLTNEGGVGSTFRLIGNVTGLWLIHECRRTWALDGRNYSFGQLVALAKESAPLRSLIDPNDPIFAEPGDMPQRIRAYCAHTNQPEPIDPGAVTRCVLESLALKHAQTVGVLADVAGVSPRAIHIVGGGARNELLCRWTANAAGLTVLAGPEEATLLGNLAVQAMSLGEIGSLDEARAVVGASVTPVRYEPEDDPTWRAALDQFARVVALPTLEVPA